MSTVKNYLSLVKFSHTIFALPFAIIGFVLGLRAQWMAQLPVEHFFLKFFLVIVCMVSARSTAMAFNRYLDRHFDKLNPRTTANNPRVDDWNKIMKKYQEGIKGTKPGETWVFLKQMND